MDMVFQLCMNQVQIYWTPKRSVAFIFILHAGTMWGQYSIDDVNG